MIQSSGSDLDLYVFVSTCPQGGSLKACAWALLFGSEIIASIYGGRPVYNKDCMGICEYMQKHMSNIFTLCLYFAQYGTKPLITKFYTVALLDGSSFSKT